MIRVLGLVVLVAALLSVGEARWSSRLQLKLRDDPLALVKEIIYNANQDIDKKNMSVVSLPDFEINFLIYKLGLKGTRAGKLDTLVLRGDKQIFTQKDEEDYSVFSFDLTLGLDQLYVQTYISRALLLMFKSDADVNLSIVGDTLRVKGTIISRNDGTCSASLDSAVLEDLGKVTVSVNPSSISNWLFKQLVSAVANYGGPILRGAINRNIASTIKDEQVKSNFEKSACAPFVI